MSIESLKAQARRHEQNDEWQKALDEYGKAIAALDKDEQPDIGLYNRVGDLYVRVGNYDQALQHYEKAVELYREAFLHNNAIAVCKKIIRHVPARTRVYLTMGQIRAEQGFVPDARTNFLTYAERMQAEGDIDESFRALVEFCDLVPDDIDGRITVADQMVANERVDDALAQYAVAYRQLKEKGQDDRAFGLERKLLEIDPDTDFDALVADPDDGPDGGFEWSGEPAEQASFDGEADVAGGTERSVAEPGGSLRDADALVDDDALVEDGVLGGEETVADEAPADTGAARTFEEAAEAVAAAARAETDAGADDEEPDDEDGAFELPLMEGTAEFAEADDVEVAYGEVAYEDDDTGSAGPDEDDDEAFDLPLISYEDEEEESLEVAAAWEERLESRVAEPEPGPEPEPAAPASGETFETQRGAEADLDEVPVDMAEAEAQAVEPPAAAPPEEPQQYVDLGSMIFGDEPQEPKTTRFRVAYQEPTGDEAADFQQMLSQFKEKVSENLDASDVKSHYDLGTAYKEMGLLDEAISEFQSALRASPTHLPTFELMGQTFMEMGKPEAAVKSLERAVTIRAGVEDDLVGIYYYLARAYEQLDRREQAIEFYDRVFALDINFADVTDRLRALR